MTSLFRILSLFTFVAMVSCASKKPTNSPDTLSSTPEENVTLGSDSNLGSVELKGDSDAGTAGGIKTVFFGFDSSTLGESSKSTLQANAEFLKANTTVEIQVEGHCDERGGIQYNLALGEKRANAVKDYLTALGVEGSRITTISYGKEKPVAFGHDEDSWGRNRRATFVITAK